MCQKEVALTQDACPHCSFPMICDAEFAPPSYGIKRRKLKSVWKVIGLLAFVALGLTQAFYFLYRQYNDAYFGLTTEVQANVEPLSESDAAWLKIEGDGLFKDRTLLTLGLMKTRSPMYYEFVANRITSVTELQNERRMRVNDHHINLHGVGAMVESLSGKMWIKTRMAFGADVSVTSDWSVFNYASTLVHEAMHVELRKQGIELGTIEEEVECEKAALDFLIKTGGPQVLIDSKETYLKHPESSKYQRWYRWYHQFTQGG